MSDDRNRAKLVSDFNKSLIKLMRYIDENVPNTPIDRILNLMKVAKRVDHEILITSVGPYLFRYRDVIKTRNLNAFTSDDIHTELAKYPGIKKKQIALETFTALFSIKDSLDSSKTEHMFSSLDYLLSTYLSFAIRCRHEEKL